MPVNKATSGDKKIDRDKKLDKGKKPEKDKKLDKDKKFDRDKKINKDETINKNKKTSGYEKIDRDKKINKDFKIDSKMNKDKKTSTDSKLNRDRKTNANTRDKKQNGDSNITRDKKQNRDSNVTREKKQNRDSNIGRDSKVIGDKNMLPGNSFRNKGETLDGQWPRRLNNAKKATENQAVTAHKKRDTGHNSGERNDENYTKKGDSNHKNYIKNAAVKEKKNQALCPVVKKCGGCQLLDMNYDLQLKSKQKRIEGLLGKFAKVGPIVGMDNPYHYRNKVHAVFDHDRKGNPISGVYEAGTHRVVPVENCLIEDQQADAIIGSIRGMLKSFKIRTYDEDTEFGLIRHVLIRKGFHSGQIMVVLVLSSPILPSKNNFVKALLKKHPEITTIIINVNNKRTSMVLGEKEQVIYGKGYIEDSLCGKIFRISPKSFYQVNTVQTEFLYGKAIELAGLTGTDTVIDAYCGIGTISLIAADHAKKVIGVELNSDAVRDAKTNATRNQVSNVDFYNKDAGEFMKQLADQGEVVDVVFMDPPRAGSDEKFLNSLCTLAPARVVYISCNPETLERDLNYLVKNKYKVEKVIPVDMFPGTVHVECIIMMTYCGQKDK